MNIEEKTKLAHEYFRDTMAFIRKEDVNHEFDLIIEESWQYADAMEAEAEKRIKAEAKEKREAVRKLLNDDGTFLEKEGQHFEDLNSTDSSELEFQVDWSVAPENAEEWSVKRGGVDARWTCYCDGDKYYVSAPLFNYRGDWKDSLRKRPK